MSETTVNRRLEQALATLTSLSIGAAGRAEQPQRVLDATVRAALDMLHGDVALIALFEGSHEELVVRAIAGPTEALGTTVPFGDSVMGTVAAMRRPEVVADLPGDPRRIESVELRGIVRGVFAPLAVGDACLGAIMVGQTSARRSDDDSTDLTLLSMLGEQTASILQSARTLEEERRFAHTLSRLSGYVARAESGSGADGVGDLLREIAMAAGGEAAAIAEESDDGAFHITHSWNLSEESVAAWNAGTWKAATKFETSFSAVIPAARAHFEPRYVHDLLVRAARSGARTGLHILSSERSSPFRTVHLRIAEVMAVHVGAMLDRMALLQQMQASAEAERQASLRLRELYDDIDEGIVVLDGGVQVKFASRRACHILQASPHQLLGKSLFEAIDTEDRMPLLGAMVKALGGAKATGELRLIAGGRTHTVEFTCRHEDGGDPSHGVRMLLRDVTEERRRESETLHREKLASVGELAAGVAHEINNPTSFVLSNFSWLARRLPDLQATIELHRAFASLPEVAAAAPEAAARLAQADEALAASDVIAEAPQVLADSLDGLERVRRIVGDMRMFARKDPEAPSEVDVVKILDAALGMASPMVRMRAQVVRDIQPLPALNGWPGRLSQVFLNLIVNAGQAVVPGDAAGNKVTVRAWADEEEVHVAVSDTGRGISPEHRMKIFSPFFTTKPPGEGTGLGLALAYEAVRRHGGRIHVDSIVGKGSTFTVSIPRLAAEPLAQASREGLTPARGTLRLVV